MASLGEIGSAGVQDKLRPGMHLGMGPGVGAGAGAGAGAGPVLRPGTGAGAGAQPLSTRTESADLVSRLLAATPPYLYSLPHPTSFFFSEMLRSLVAAKAGDAPAPQSRRPRKRTWRDSVKPPAPAAPHPHPPPDKPLELTTPRAGGQVDDKQPPPPVVPPPSLSPPGLPPPPMGMAPCGLLPPLPSPESALPPDLLLPPSQPPLWYPPLYPLPPHQPPYPIDPLHFFIDLRVSGHIFDRKSKEGEAGDDPKAPPPESGSAPASSLVRHTKHCSAFSVPQPRSKHAGSPKDQHLSSDNLGPNYVLQNLSRIYDDVRPFAQRRSHPIRCSNLPKMVEAEANNNSIKIDESKPIVLDDGMPPEEIRHKQREEGRDAGCKDNKDESEEEKKKKDIRALLGLELVVDYVNQGGVRRKNRRSGCHGDRGRSVSDDEDDDVEEVIVAKEEDSDSSPDDEDKRSLSRPQTPVLCSSSPPLFQQHPGLGIGLGPGVIPHHFQAAVRPPHPHPHPPPFGGAHFLRDASDALNLQVRH